MQSDFLIHNISKLLNCSDFPVPFRRGQEMSLLPELNNAWILVQQGIIKDFGTMDSIPNFKGQWLDAEFGMVMPTWVDAHTHLVFAETRENEFVDRIQGLSYQEISAKGGGILQSAKKLSLLSEDELFERSWDRMMFAISRGTGGFEIKSGYGLSTESELKMLRVIQRLKKESGLPIRSTFLGAHSFPLEFRDNHKGYIDRIISEMLPAIADEQLADYCDVFCEKGFYSLEETELIFEAAKKYNLKLRLHTNQFTHSGGIEMAIKHRAVSVDHLEELNELEMESLKSSSVYPITLPTAAFFMNCNYPPARKMINANLGLVIASDYNPGTAPTPDMNLCFSLACINMKMMPTEAFNAMTINAAYALGYEKELGSIERGKLAHLIVSRPDTSLNLIPYSLSSDWIQHVILGAVEEEGFLN